MTQPTTQVLLRTRPVGEAAADYFRLETNPLAVLAGQSAQRPLASVRARPFAALWVHKPAQQLRPTTSDKAVGQ